MKLKAHRINDLVAEARANPNTGFLGEYYTKYDVDRYVAQLKIKRKVISVSAMVNLILIISDFVILVFAAVDKDVKMVAACALLEVVCLFVTVLLFAAILNSKEID